ncbi:MAG: cytochrome c oxidase assembly protein [Cycloclasticus sp.]|nr:cytochrome c oxidase assembly protein [Cycloclasticus sp.]MBQ0790382.1 cytochrome c oxidase assembly protein [Cycloclasticus sp.]
MSALTYLLPWEFSPALLLSVLITGGLYTRAIFLKTNKERTAKFYWQVLSFYLGLVAIYIVSHTYVDYLSQYMFWVHRFQHLVLHHLGPLLLVLGGVQWVQQGAPSWFSSWSKVPAFIRVPCELCYRFIQHPVVAPVVFVGLIYLWLIPEIHFAAMLSKKLYWIMNWSMLIDGFLFWWLVLGPEWQGEQKGFKTRLLMMVVVVVPQQLLGAYLTLSRNVLYDVYDVCGRAWPISPLSDQIYGGVITWIPASMMSVLGLVLVLRRRLNYLKRKENELS